MSTYTGTLISDLQKLAADAADAERRYVEEVSKHHCSIERHDEYGKWSCPQRATGKCEGCGIWICDKHLWIVQVSPEKAAMMCAECASHVN